MWFCEPPARPAVCRCLSVELHNNWKDLVKFNSLVWATPTAVSAIFCTTKPARAVEPGVKRTQDGVQRVSRAFWQPALLGDSSWTLHRANSGTGCTKTWPRSEVGPYIKPDGLRFRAIYLTRRAHKKQLCGPIYEDRFWAYFDQKTMQRTGVQR